MKRIKKKTKVMAKKRRRRTRKIPDDVMRLIQELMDRHSKHSTFAYFTKEDMAQEIFIICLEIYQKYDNKKGTLRPFMETSLRNRLRNFRRDMYFRPTPPCVLGKNKCPKFRPNKPIEDHACTKRCAKFKAHQEMIWSKMNIINTITFDPSFTSGKFYDEIARSKTHDYERDIRAIELDTTIRKKIPDDLVNHYDRMVRGLSVSRRYMSLVRLFVSSFLVGENYGTKPIGSGQGI